MKDNLLSMFENASKALGEPILFAVVGRGQKKNPACDGWQALM